MMLRIKDIEVWTTTLVDETGSLARLLEDLAEKGVELDCLFARRDLANPGFSRLYATPISNPEQRRHAKALGLTLNEVTPTLQVESLRRPGLATLITQALRDAGISLHGFTGMSLGRRFTCYLGFDSKADRERAAAVLLKLRIPRGPVLKPLFKRPLRRRPKLVM